MTNGNMDALNSWAKALVAGANASGFLKLPELASGSDLPTFLSWARAAAGPLGSFSVLPAIEVADFSSALAWARAVDQSARPYNPSLPELPA